MTSVYERQHEQGKTFSGLLFGADLTNTCVEIGVRLSLMALGVVNPGGLFSTPDNSQSLVQVAVWMCIMSVFVRLYTVFLERAYFKFPHYRTQPPLDHKLRDKVDLTGREVEELDRQNAHDRYTLILDGLLAAFVYATVPGFFPAANAPQQSWLERGVRLVLHQYVLAFTMYWAHRAGHVVPFKWAYIHGRHHQAKHPLSRVTYEAHFFDNFMNAIYGHTFAQFLVPLDFVGYYACQFLRIMESLEKHSGISCHLNVAHNMQRWLPFSQMPHHHDLHHEGTKGYNFTFTAAGGLWDWAFGTRKAGRAEFLGGQATDLDRKQKLAEERALAQRLDHGPDAPAAADSTSSAGPLFSLAEVAKHNTTESAWIVIDGVVYDVTNYAKKHPGGEVKLLDVAGRDATNDFEEVRHSKAARVILRSLRVGELPAAEKVHFTPITSIFDNPIVVHLPVFLSAAMVALFGPAGSGPLAAFATVVLIAEMVVCHVYDQTHKSVKHD